MSGYTSLSYRRFMEKFGVAASFTEMTSAPGLVHNAPSSRRFILAGDAPTGAQLFGTDPADFAAGAEVALSMEPKLRFFDINMGCPVKKVVREGAGSDMMRDPGLCGRVVRAVKDETGLPVTAKIRLGENRNEMNYREVVDALLRADVAAVTIHSRTVAQQYGGIADHSRIAGYGDELPVPLIVSGDINTPEAARDALEVTGATAVMVARGGVGNPYLVTRINSLLDDGELLPEPTMAQQVDWCLELIKAIEKELGAPVALSRMRGIAPKFLAGCRYSNDFRRAITNRDTDLDGVRAVLKKVKAEMGDDLRMSCRGRAGTERIDVVIPPAKPHNLESYGLEFDRPEDRDERAARPLNQL